MSDVSEHAFIDLLGITKRYAGVTALDGVDFTFHLMDLSHRLLAGSLQRSCL